MGEKNAHVPRKSSIFYRNSVLEASERKNSKTRRSNENEKTSDKLDKVGTLEVGPKEVLPRRSQLGMEIGLSAQGNPSDNEIEVVSHGKQKELLSRLTGGY